MRKLRRIKTSRFRTTACWVEKQDETYIAYRSLINAAFGIASPTIMSVGNENLKLAYETKKL